MNKQALKSEVTSAKGLFPSDLKKFRKDHNISNSDLGTKLLDEPLTINWEEPILFGQIDTPEIPTSVLPAWLDDYAKALAASTQTPPAMSVMLILAALATCLQRRFVVRPREDNNYCEPLTLWCLVALPPASRKTAVINAVMEPIRNWETDQFAILAPEIQKLEDEASVINERINSLKKDASKEPDEMLRQQKLDEVAKLRTILPELKKQPRLWTGDTTPERLQGLLAEYEERMSVITDEGGIFEIMAGLYNDGKINIDVFLQGHAGSPVRVDRGTREVWLKRPALSFGLAVQPAIIGELMQGSKRKFRGNGALARFMYCLPKSNIGHRDVKQNKPIPVSVQAEYLRKITNLLASEEGKGEEPITIGLTEKALESWQDFAQSIENRQGTDGDLEQIQDWSGKLPGHCLRIAALCHIAECGAYDCKPVSEKAIQRAIKLCTLLIPHAQAAFELMESDKATNDAKFLFKWIAERKEDTFRQTDALKKGGRFNKGGGGAERLEKALAVLQIRNIISQRNFVPGEGSKPIYTYEVNPSIFEDMAPPVEPA